MGVPFSGRLQSMHRKLHIERLEDRRVMAADFNGDATVDNFDLGVWKFGYGTVAAAAQAQGNTDGDTDVDGDDFLQWQRDLGPKKNNLIAYRPQSVQDDDDPLIPNDGPIDGPIYDPFRQRPVDETLEENASFGPGIRINHDDDDNNRFKDATEPIANNPYENDLIEVKIERLHEAGDLARLFGTAFALAQFDLRSSLPSRILG